MVSNVIDFSLKLRTWPRSTVPLTTISSYCGSAGGWALSGSAAAAGGAAVASAGGAAGVDSPAGASVWAINRVAGRASARDRRNGENKRIGFGTDLTRMDSAQSPHGVAETGRGVSWE